MKAKFNQFADRLNRHAAARPVAVIAALAAFPTLVMAADINKTTSFTGSATGFVGNGGNYGNNNRLQIGLSATGQTFIINSGTLTDGAVTLPPNSSIVSMNILGTSNIVTFTGSSTQVIITNTRDWRSGGTGNGSFHLMGTGNTMNILAGATFTANGWNGIDGSGNTLLVDGTGSKATFSASGSDGFGNSQGSDQFTTNRVNITNGGAVYVNSNGIHNLVATAGAGNYAVNVDGSGGRSVFGVTSISHNGAAGGGIAHIFNGGALETNADGGANANQFDANSQAAKIFIDGGVISYRNATAAQMNESTAGSASGFTYAGNNAMRLNNSASTDTGSYTLANNVGLTPSKNYTRLEMINGTTSVARAITIDGGNGGSMLFDGTNATVSNGVTLSGAATLTATGAASTLAGAIGGSGSLIKTGAGTLTLSSASITYSGNTTVSEGILNMSASGLTVGNGKFLNGSGTLIGAVNVSGTLAPGNSIESLAITGDLTMNNASTFAYEMHSTSITADLQKVTGNVVLTGTVNLNLDDLAAPDAAFATGTKFSLINYTGSLSGGFFYGVALGEGDSFTAGLNHWTITYGDAEGGVNFTGEYIGGADKFVNLTLTAIPEPGSWLALGCLMGSGVYLRSRRRRA